MSSLLFPAYKLNRQNTQPENVCDIIFEKAKCHESTVNRASVYVKSTVGRVPWKRCFEKFTRKHMCLNHFFGTFLWILRIFSVKNVQLWSFFCPVFPVFGLNTEIYGVNLRTQSECRKIRTWKNSVFGHFSCSIHTANFATFRWFSAVYISQLINTDFTSKKVASNIAWSNIK